MNVHRTGLARRNVPPGGFQQLVPGNRFPGVLRQLAEQTVFLFRQGAAFPVHIDGPVLVVQIQLCVAALMVAGLQLGRFRIRDGGPGLVEVVLDPFEQLGPKAASKKLPDGTMVSAPLEDLAPFLPREEFAANMLIPPVEQG